MQALRTVLRYTAWPGLILGFMVPYLLFTDYTPGNMDLENGVLTIFLMVSLFLGTVIVERIIPYRRDWNRLGRQELNDVGHMMLCGNAEQYGRLIALALLPLVYAPLPKVGDGLWPTDAPMAAQAALAVVVYDLAYYWVHRASHHWEPLWRIHRLHHTPEHLGVTKGFRIHGLESLLDGLYITVIFASLGAPTEALALRVAIIFPMGVLTHANIDTAGLPRWLDPIITSPSNHRIHHDTSTGAFRNYGGGTLVWDVLFGTYLNPSDYPVDEIGLGDTGVHAPQSFSGQLLDFARKY